MQSQKRVVLACAVLSLVVGLNGCAWMSNTMSRAKERIVAMRDRITAKKQVEESAAAAPAQVAAATAGASADGMSHGHHVISGTGRPISNALGECVNTGFAGGEGHSGCGGADNVAQAAAPVVETTPMAEQPIEKAEVPAPAPVAAAAPQATAQPSEELFPPATEPVSAPAPAAAAPTPQPQAAPAAAAAAPAVVEQPMPKPPVPTEQISLSADALFPFAKYNEASMLPAGKAKLKELASHIKSVGPGGLTRVAITGHADRIGRTDRKQLISERRAQTVRNYLVKLGVDPSLMSAAGKSDSEPVVTSCKGNKPTAKLKSCLAPNRRVDVAFFGDKDKLAHLR